MDVKIQSSSSFEEYPLQVRHKQDWGRGFILLLPQTAALPGSDAGSDVIKPASSFVIQNDGYKNTVNCSVQLVWDCYTVHCAVNDLLVMTYKQYPQKSSSVSNLFSH